jgi:ADP-ribose pyrophosphatase YjhB (NUDIX family)
MAEIWKPHVVVAAVIERNGRFLLVEEETLDGIRINQPAGHLEPGESIVDAVRREVLEETARTFEPEALIAIYRLPAAGRRPDFIRFTFCGRVGEPQAERALDEGILRADWMTLEEIRRDASRHRSPLVTVSIDDYLAGLRCPLDVLRDCER